MEGKKRPLRTPDSRNIEDNSGVGSQTHPSGMSNPIAVEEGDIGQMTDLWEGFNKSRNLSKGEKPRNIGEIHSPYRRNNFDSLELGELHDNDDSGDSIPGSIVAKIDTSDKGNFPAPPLEAQPFGQLLLNPCRLIQTDLPLYHFHPFIITHPNWRERPPLVPNNRVTKEVANLQRGDAIMYLGSQVGRPNELTLTNVLLVSVTNGYLTHSGDFHYNFC